MRLARGIAMVEAVLATVIVGGLAVAAMSLVGTIATERRVAADRSVGHLLARQLAEEIAALPLDHTTRSGAEGGEDSEDGNDNGGRSGGLVGGILGGVADAVAGLAGEEPDEPDSADRSLLLDVLDYDGYTKSPPVDREGTALPGVEAWMRSVEVTEVLPGDPDGPEVGGTGVYRVRVTATLNGRLAGEMVFYRSLAGDEAVR